MSAEVAGSPSFNDSFERTPEELAAAQDGVPVDEIEYIDYFGFEERHKYYLPDGKQFFEFKTLNEGEISVFQRSSNREIIVQRRTGDAKMRVDPASDRHTLIKTSLTGWNLMQRSVKNSSQRFVPVLFNDREIERVLREFPPHIIQGLESAIRDKNPALKADRTPQEIKEEIQNLQRELEEAERAELGKLSS